LLVATVAFAQEVIIEPSKVNVFYRLGGGELTQLEQQTTSGTQLRHGFMSAKVAGTTDIPGGHSLVRFQSGALEFVVATGGDPAVYSLRKADTKKNKRGETRELLIVTARGALFGSAKTNTADSVIPLDFSRYGTSSYKAVPRQTLVPGEYALFRPDNPTVFCFGVD
jgi:hypothetical protein